MKVDTLCSLIAKQINPEYFQLWGLDIHWMKEEYATQENKAIVESIIDDYDNLAAQFEREQKIIMAREAYKAEADPIYIEWQALLFTEHPEAGARRLEWIAKRAEIKSRLEV
jgi:hypothetical protein